MENIIKAKVKVKVSSIIELCRIKQYTKNLIILFPTIIASESNVSKSIIAVFVFSLLASAVYCINDVKDALSDLYHPEKQYRPIPSGRVQESEAFKTAVVLIITSFFCSWYFELEIIKYLFAYLIINVFYSTIAKEMAGIDILIVSSGFIIRALIGFEFVEDPKLVYWVIWPIFLGSISMTIGKRYIKITKQKEKPRISKYYSDKTLIGGLFASSFLTVFFSTILLDNHFYNLLKNFQFSKEIIYITSFFLIILYSRCIYLMSFLKIEPADIFYKDKPMIIGLLSCLVIITAILQGG